MKTSVRHVATRAHTSARRAVAPVFAALSLVLACAPAEEPVAVELPDEDFVAETTLENGLRVLVAEVPGSGMFASNVFIRAGAMRETPELSGAAHFLEHLLFNGTTSRTQEELYDDVDRIGGYNNASTRPDYAVFMFVAGTDVIADALDIQSDMLFRSTLPPAKFEKERGIVLEEIAKDRSNPSYAASLVTDEILYAGTPYARPVLGTEASIKGLSYDGVEAYYHRYYVPSNMTLLLMGDLPREELLAQARTTFGAVEADAHPEAPQPLPPLAETRIVARKVDDTTNRVTVRLPAPGPGDDAFAAVELLTDIVASGDGSRIRRAMDADPAVGVQGVGGGLVHVGGRTFLDVSIELSDPGMIEPAVARVLGELHRVRDGGVTAAELAAAKVSRRTEEASLREQIHYYGFMRGDLVRTAPEGYLNSQRSRYAALTTADVAGAARAWLAAPVVEVVATGPEVAERDEAVTAEALGFATPPVTIEISDGEVAAAPRVPPRASEASGPTMTTLEGGLRLVTVSNPASDVLAVHVMALGRSYLEPEGKDGITDFLHRLLTRGAGELSKHELATRLDAIGATIKTHDAGFIPYDDYYTTPEFSYVRMGALDEFHEEAFALLGDMIARPRLTADEIEQARSELLAQAEKDARSPNTIASRAFRRALWGDDDRGARPIGGTAETIASITREDLVAHHARVMAPSNLVVTVVTGMPSDVVESAVSSWFDGTGGAGAGAGGASGDPGTPWSRETSTRPPVGGEPTTVRLAVDAQQSSIYLGYAMQVAPDDFPALRVATMLLSDRMAFQLRERQGLAYSIGASLTTWKDRGVLTARMGTRADNVDLALRGMAAQLDSLAVTPEDDAKVALAVNARIGRTRMRGITRMGQAYALAMDVLMDRELGTRTERLMSLDEVSADDVRRVAETYVASDRADRVIVTPE